MPYSSRITSGGSSEESVLKMLEAKGITVSEREEYSLTDEVKISYGKNNYYGRPCTVTFEISREFGLYEVFIDWGELSDAKSFQESVKVNLLNSYGSPAESDSGKIELEDGVYEAWVEGDSWSEGGFSISLVSEYPDSTATQGIVSITYADIAVTEEMHRRLMDATE